MSEGRYKCDLLGAKAKRAILELSSSAADSECTDHVVEKLFSIALFSISSLEQTRTNHPEAVRTFASKQTQWPYMLDAPGRDNGWVESSRMPEGLHGVLIDAFSFEVHCS